MAKRGLHAPFPPRRRLPPMPIPPAWITQGKASACGTILAQSPDGRVSSGYWSCTTGKFDWAFTWDEFAHILEGQVTIKQDNGKTCKLGPGDCVHFPRGLKTHWHITKPIRKFFVIRTPKALKVVLPPSR